MATDPGGKLWYETTNRLAREVSVRVTASYLRYAQGVLTLDESIGISASLIAAAQRRAVTFNDILLATELTRQLEAEHTATGLQWYESADEQTVRLSRAVSTVIGDDVAYIDAAAAGKTREQVMALQARSIRSRLDRLTNSEVVGASQWSRQQAMQIHEDQGVIAGWYRRLSSGACKWCHTLGGPGDPGDYIHSAHSRMPTHPNCSCSQGWVSELEPGMTYIGPHELMKTLPGWETASTVKNSGRYAVKNVP
jgi:hypothetical protein